MYCSLSVVCRRSLRIVPVLPLGYQTNETREDAVDAELRNVTQVIDQRRLETSKVNLVSCQPPKTPSTLPPKLRYLRHGWQGRYECEPRSHRQFRWRELRRRGSISRAQVGVACSDARKYRVSRGSRSISSRASHLKPRRHYLQSSDIFAMDGKGSELLVRMLGSTGRCAALSLRTHIALAIHGEDI
jgi:hypothetical protein